MSDLKFEIPEFLVDKPDTYCRFCCSNVELQSIFAERKDSCQQIVRLVAQLTNITLTEAEDFHSAICGECLRMLFEFDQFRKRCKFFSNEIIKRRQEAADKVIMEIKEDSAEISPQNHIEISKASPTNNAPNINDKPLKQAKPRMQPKLAKNRGSLMAKLFKSKRKNAKCATVHHQQSIKLREFRCKICRQFFTDKESINLHMRKHVDSVNLKCHNCATTSETLQGLIQHAIQSYIAIS